MAGTSGRFPIPDLIIEIDLPPALLSPNGAQRNVYERAQAKALHRSEACTKARQALIRQGGKNEPVPIVIHHDWYFGKSRGEDALKPFRRANGLRAEALFYRPRDVQNAIIALKAAVDGLVDARIVPDDSDRWVQWGRCRLLRTPAQHGGRSGIVLRLEPMEAA